MNLRARIIGLISLSALSLFSCEEDISTIGLPPENNLGIFFAEIPLEDNVTQIWIDRVNTRATNSLLSGHYEDLELGPISARNYSQVLLSGFDSIPEDATYDSMVLRYRITDFTGYDVNNSTQSFELFRLTEKISADDTTDVLPYYNTNSIALGQKLGESSFTIYTDSLGLLFSDSDFKLNTTQDTLFKNRKFDRDSIYLYNHSFRINDGFGLEFFNKAKGEKANEFTDEQKFSNYLKGFALIPNPSNSAIVHYRVDNSYLRLYYTNSDGSSDFFDFILNKTSSFNNITPNVQTGWADPLTGIQTFQPFNSTTGLIYLQSGTNLIAKIDLSQFRSFEDSLGHALIESAKLVVEVEDDSEFLIPNSRVSFTLTSKDSLETGSYFEQMLPNTQNLTALRYNESLPGYTIDLPLYLESLEDESIENDQLILFLGEIGFDSRGNPFASPTAYEIKKIFAKKENFKIQLYYTVPEAKD